MPERKILPQDLEARIDEGMSIADLARHYKWQRETMRAVLKRDAPELAERAAANGNLRKAALAGERAERINKQRALASRKNRQPAPLDFNRERLLRKIDLAMRHLQRQRLGPCYSWKTGYYWMGKCLSAEELMAEAIRRGWKPLDEPPRL